MSELFNFYQEQALANSSANDLLWLKEIKTKALYDLNRLGFPNRKNEEWKYTLLDSFFKQPFKPFKLDNERVDNSFAPFEWAASIQNGIIYFNDEFKRQLPKEVIFESLLTAIHTHPDLVKSYLGKLLKTEHGFQALNTAAMQTGLFIYVPADVHLEQPLVINHWQDNDNQAVHVRHLIIADERSNATIIESYQGLDNCCYFTNVISEMHLAAQAKLTHYKIQCEAKSAYHIGHIAVQQSQQSQCSTHSLSVGGKLVRSDLTFDLTEENAYCGMNGIYLPGNNQHIDHHTNVNHLVPNCQSVQDYKGILNGQATAVFNGKICVAKHAQHTDAKQQNKNLLLSEKAQINTKPQLEIFADDVVCSHGATVGQLDDDALFYLATRGIGINLLNVI